MVKTNNFEVNLSYSLLKIGIKSRTDQRFLVNETLTEDQKFDYLQRGISPLSPIKDL